MALYALGDTHLSVATDKPMDIFGGAWEHYLEKLERGLAVLKPEDCIVICGDISWAMTLEEAAEDLRWLNRFPGRKILLKGNHDFWWGSASKMQKFFSDNGLKFEILHNNSLTYGNVWLCGTRGWLYDQKNDAGHNEKIFQRELQRLELSLKAAGEGEKYCFFHYPPVYRGYERKEFPEIMEQYHVRKCFYGHLHGASHRLAVEGDINGISYQLVSADYLHFKPYEIIK